MIKKILYISIILLISINSVIAEEDNVTVTEQSILSYTVNDGSGTAGSVMNQIYLDTTNYNQWESFHINLSLQSPTFALDSETSQFTVSSGGTGAGYVWYVKETKKLYYAFTSLTVTSSPITLTYTKNIVANITGMTRLKNDCSASITQPILLYKETVGTPRCLAGLYESVTVDSTTTDHYLVTYPFSNAFTLNVTKGGSVNDKWVVYDVDGNIYMTGTTDKLNFVLTNNSYNGIIANVSLSTGAYTIVYINTSGISEPTSTYNILFNKTSYNLNDDVFFITNISNFNINDNHYILFSQEVIGDAVYTQNYPISSSITTTYPQIDKTKISFLYGQIIKNGVSVYTSSAIPYGMYQNISNITGNITLDKNQYGLGENINIKYNISVSGRIIVQCQNILYSENVFAGNNLQTNYTISNLELFPCQIKLQYYYSDVNDWVTLDYKIYETIESVDNIFFSKDYASLGDTINVYYNTMGDRYIVLKDSQNNIKFNYSVPLSQYGLYKQYTLISTDPTGNYTAFLNYTNDTIIMTATIKIMDAIVIAPVHTTNATYSLFDLFSDGSKAIVGDIDLDQNGDISDNEIKKKGDKAYYIFIFLALVILISGTWNKLIRRK